MLLWVVLLSGLGGYCYYLSRLQPFPEKGGRFAIVLFSGALVLWISSTSPEEVGGDLPSGCGEEICSDVVSVLHT